MTHAASIKDIYNGLVHEYQVNHHSLLENQAPDNIRRLLNTKASEQMTLSLDMLAHFACRLGEPELAGIIRDSAAQLSCDFITPKPM